MQRYPVPSILPSSFYHAWEKCVIRLASAGMISLAQNRRRVSQPATIWRSAVVDRGELMISVGAQSLVVPPGHRILMPPGLPIERHAIADCAFFVMEFHVIPMADAFDPFPRLYPPRVQPLLDRGEHMRIRARMLEAIGSDWRFPIDVRAVILRPLVEAEVSSIIQEIAATWKGDPHPQVPTPDWFGPVINIMKKRLDDPGLSLAELAACAGYTPQYLCRWWQRIYGISPIAMLLNQRLDRAREILTSRPGIPIAEVLRLTGFASQSRFYSAFKKKYGSSPRGSKADA